METLDRNDMPSKVTPGPDDWRARLLDTPEQIDHILQQVKRVAVIGIKPREVGAPPIRCPPTCSRKASTSSPCPCTTRR